MLKYFWNIDGKKKKKIVLYYFAQVLIAFLGVATALLSGGFIDNLIEADLEKIFRSIIAFSVICITEICLGYLKERAETKLQMRLGNAGGLEIIYHLNETFEYVHEKGDKAATVQKVNNDVNAVVIFGLNAVGGLIGSIFMFTASIVLLAVIYPFCFICILIVFLAYSVFYMAVKNLYYTKEMEFKEKQVAYFSELFEQLNKSRFMFIFGVTPFFRKRMNKAYCDVEDKALSLQRVGYLFNGVSEIIKIMGTFVIYAICGIGVYEKKISVGEFYIIIAAFEFIMQACVGGFDYAKEYQNTRVSFDRLCNLGSIEKFRQGEIKKNNSINSITVRNLSISLEGKQIIKDFNYTFNKDNVYCLTGKNGSGKSTLLECLLGLYAEQTEGEIIFDGNDISAIDMQSLRKDHIGYVEQEPTILKDSLKSNINVLSDEEADPSEELLEMLNFKAFYRENSKKVFDDNGASLSGGEKQKIEILRNLLDTKDILMMDEPTSSMDSDSIERFIKYIKTIKNNRIIIIVSHDQRMIENCNYVLQLG
jgi:ATP-binding cassette subfamily C protein